MLNERTFCRGWMISRRMTPSLVVGQDVDSHAVQGTYHAGLLSNFLHTTIALAQIERMIRDGGVTARGQYRPRPFPGREFLANLYSRRNPSR
jgi:hypothetical protein